jgi:hypothetical protein
LTKIGPRVRRRNRDQVAEVARHQRVAADAHRARAQQRLVAGGGEPRQRAGRAAEPGVGLGDVAQRDGVALRHQGEAEPEPVELDAEALALQRPAAPCRVGGRADAPVQQRGKGPEHQYFQPRCSATMPPVRLW